MKKNRKKILPLILLFIAIVMIITGGILAYLTDTDHKTNVFTVGSVKINIRESNWNPTNGENILPGQPINKDPAIQNIGKNSAYVYMKIEQPSVDLANNTEGPLFNYTTNNGWTLLGTNANQGCPTTTSVYYYNTQLASNSTTSTLFDSVTINDFNELTDTYPMNIEVTGYAIQSSYLPNGTTIQSAYSTYFDNSGLVGCVTPIIQATSENDKTAFRSDTYSYYIKTITLDDQINIPENVVDSWDIGVHQNGDVMAYVIPNSDDNTMLDLHIEGNGALYANPDSSYLFAYLGRVESITGLDKLNTSKVTNMEGMFYGVGGNSPTINIDLGDHFDTSKVTNMSNMFSGLGYGRNTFDCEEVSLDLGDHFDTSKVTNMSRMFNNMGNYCPKVSLNLGNKFDTRNVTNMSDMFSGMGTVANDYFSFELGDKFDTSKVTNMASMFDGMGTNASNFTLDLGNKFDTSNVTNMEYMFSNSSSCVLNLGDKFNTSKVTNMEGMFNSVSSNCTNFTLDLGDKFDTSNVTNMKYMFLGAGFDSTNFSIDLGDKFNTSNVTNMSWMFASAGYSNPLFTLDLGDKFDTSNVTNMSDMFYRTGHSSLVFTLNFDDKFDTSNVTNMEGMFRETGYSSPIFTLDLGNKFDTSNVTNMDSMFWETGYSSPLFIINLGNKFDTSNVTSMERMFEKTGYNNSNFTLDLGNLFDTSKVRSMRYMFSQTGYSNSNLILDLSLFNFGSVTRYDNIFDGMRSTGKIYVGNSTARSWIINNSGNSNLTTSNVIIKP